MKLSHLIKPLAADFRTILNAHNIPLSMDGMEHGETGLKACYRLLDIVSKNRAYDDTHPGFSSGAWKRLLPFDGRDYCFYYANGANDTHLATLLRHVKAELANEAQKATA